LNEAEAIARLKQGDIAGLRVLVETFQAEAVRAAYLIVRDRPMAEDVVQSAFIKVYDRRNQFDASRRFAPWFLRIVVNDAVKAARRRNREVSLEETTGEESFSFASLLTDTIPDPAMLAEEAELQETVWKAVGQLAPQQRRAIVLRYYLEMKEAEVAAEMEMAPSTIKRLLYDARGRLRWLLRQGV
jgi:RNA polymerase sigma-70 factor (ECF subfamily)